MSDATAIDRFFDALRLGDVPAARACCDADVRIWHGFDGIALDLDSAASGWTGLVTHFPERSFEDARRYAIDGGYVQQHVMVVRTSAGARKAWPVCIVVKMKDDLIARLDEYIDRAGSVAVPEGPVVTPGFSAG